MNPCSKAIDYQACQPVWGRKGAITPESIRFQEVNNDGEVSWKGGAASATAKAHDLYLSDIGVGVTSALQAALRTLLRQDLLPDNPAFFLAIVVTAFHDRAPGWSDSAAVLLREVDASGPTVHDASRHICKLSGFRHAWGLPHTLRCIDVRGMQALHHVLVHNLHNSFCWNSAPFRADNQGAVARIMCSLQGSAISYNPSRQLFPKLRVRADVLISGMTIEDAVDKFGSIILRDSRDVQQLPLNSLVSIRAVTPVSCERKGADEKRQGNSTTAMTQQQIEADTALFFHMVKKAVVSSMVLEAEFVVVAEVAEQGAGKSHDPHSLMPTFCSAIKIYHLHVQAVESVTDNAFINAAALTHYADVPYEALYSGVFLEEAAMRVYISMYHSEVGPPYTPSVRATNEELLVQKVTNSFKSGQQLEGLQHLAFYCLLQDAASAQQPLPDDERLPPLEDLLDSSQTVSRLTVVPEIFRVFHSNVSRLTRIADSLVCLEVLLSRFDALRQLEWSLRENTQVPEARKVPAQEFDIMRELLNLIATLKMRIRSCLGCNAFAGLSMVADLLLSRLPTSSEHLQSVALISDISRGVQKLSLLVKAASMTAADAVAFRSTALAGLLTKVGVQASWSVTSVSAAPKTVFPEWKLAVQTASSQQVRAGVVPATLALEGVRMRYLTDARIDELMAAIYRAITRPPVLRNPFGCIVSIMRCFACQMETGQLSTEALAAEVLNALAKVGQPGCFIYAGRASKSKTTALLKLAGLLPTVAGQPQSSRADEQLREYMQATVYGTYSAVQLADAVMLHRVAALLSPLMTSFVTQSVCSDLEQAPDRCQVHSKDCWAVSFPDATYANMTMCLHCSAVASCMTKAQPEIAQQCVHGNQQERALLLVAQALLGAGRDSPNREQLAWGMPHNMTALVTEQAVARRERPDVRWQVCKSPRFSHVHVEHIYYVSGPSRKESLRAAVEVVVRQLLDLLSARKHIAHVMTVGSSIVKCDNFIKNQSAVIAGLLAALTGHAKKSDGAPQPLLMQLSRISLFAGVLRETYIPVTLDVHMHWAPVTHAADAVVSDTALGHPKIKRNVTKLWDDLAFRRVFLNEPDAITWWRHHQHLGPPSQPFHIEPYLSRSRMRAECHIQDNADFLLAAKVLAQAAVAKGEYMAAVELGRAAASHAQELSCQRKRLQAVRLLLTDTSAFLAAAKVPAQVAGLVDDVLGTVHQLMLSDKHCYFSGVRKMVATRVGGVWERARSTTGLSIQDGVIVEEMELLMRSCEVSVGHDVYNAIPAAVRKAVQAPQVSHTGHVVSEAPGSMSKEIS